ncbi:MAG: RAMP superfamily CRISPR-associated protein [Elainellaceae cyanobacterium]
MIDLAELAQPFTESITLTAVVDSALCIGAGDSSGSLSDKPILRNTDGRLVIPASQLKGRLRHECEKLTRALGLPTCRSPVPQTMCPQRVGLSENFRLDAYRIRLPMNQTGNRTPTNPESPEASSDFRQYHCIICQIFGNPTLPARLSCDDLICVESAETTPETLRPGVTINRRRGTAEDQKLYFLETSPANVSLRFIGSLDLEPAWITVDREGQERDTTDFAKALLLAGLHHIHALGGSKSTGLGWLHWENLENLQPADSAIWDALLRIPGGGAG